MLIDLSKEEFEFLVKKIQESKDFAERKLAKLDEEAVTRIKLGYKQSEQGVLISEKYQQRNIANLELAVSLLQKLRFSYNLDLAKARYDYDTQP
jgi:predicted DNA-binding transcriptional regulator YafY